MRYWSSSAKEWVTSRTVQPGDPNRRYLVASLAEIFARVEAELSAPDRDAEVGPLRRLVLSGHHWPSLTSGALDVLWGDKKYGDYTYDWVFTLFGDLHPLKGVFPAAMSQVEDLHISACATGVHDTTDHEPTEGAWPEWKMLDDARWLEMFPNLKTAWACEGHSEDCSAQLLEWAKASMVAGAGEALDATAKEFRKKRSRSRLRQGGRDWVYTIVWLRGANGLEPRKANGYGE